MHNDENIVEQMVHNTFSGGVTSNMLARELPRFGRQFYKTQGGILYGI